MVLNDAMVNDAPMEMDRIDLVAHLDTSEVWVVSNAMAMPHNFHVHDVQFQILDVGGQKPPPELAAGSPRGASAGMDLGMGMH